MWLYYIDRGGGNAFASLLTLGGTMDLLKFNDRMLTQSALASLTSSSTVLNIDETAEMMELIQNLVCVPKNLAITDILVWWATSEPANA